MELAEVQPHSLEQLLVVRSVWPLEVDMGVQLYPVQIKSLKVWFHKEELKDSWRSVNLKTLLMICTRRKQGSTRNAKKLTKLEKPWNNICTHISINDMVLRHWSSNGLLLSSTASKTFKKTTMISHCLVKSCATNAMKNSDSFNRPSKRQLLHSWEPLLKKNSLQRQKVPLQLF